MDVDIKELKKKLKKYNQEHLLLKYDEMNDADKQRLLNEINNIDFDLMEKLYKQATSPIEQSEETIEPIEHIEKDLFVLDGQNASITVFTPTDYGNLIYKATEQFACGEYDESAETWAKVLEYNGNYDLAYIGLGKACLRQNKYKEAMDYFKTKRDRRDYSKAFKYYRKEWIEANIGWMVGLLLVIIVAAFVIKIVKKVKWELETL